MYVRSSKLSCLDKMNAILKILTMDNCSTSHLYNLVKSFVSVYLVDTTLFVFLDGRPSAVIHPFTNTFYDFLRLAIGAFLDFKHLFSMEAFPGLSRCCPQHRNVLKITMIHLRNTQLTQFFMLLIVRNFCGLQNSPRPAFSKTLYTLFSLLFDSHSIVEHHFHTLLLLLSEYCS